jgi:hypothetical protein
MPFLAIVFAAGTCRLCGGWRRVVFNAGFEAGLEAAFEAVCRAPLEAVLKAISEAVFDAVPKSVELHSKQARRLPLNGAVRAAGELVRM